MRKSDGLDDAGKLDSDLLRTFLAVADAGSFTRGADRIFRTQSAASLQIRRLEEVLGHAVFERRARGVRLTPTGERLLPAARRVVDLIDRTVGELRADTLQGSVRVAIPDEYGGTLLPRVIAHFARDHPAVELVVRCGFSAGFAAALARGELDVAVLAAEEPAQGGEVLRRERTVWAGSADHAAHRREPLPVALFDRSCWWRDRAIEALEASGRRYRVTYSSESVAGVLAAIRAGAAVGVIGESSLGEGLRVLTPAEGFADMPQSLLMLACREGARTPAVDAMAVSIRQAFERSG